MQDTESTLTSPLGDIGGQTAPLLALTIVWHPILARVGEQFIVTTSDLELNRYMPLFHPPGAAGTGLGYSGVSREPVRLLRAGDEIVEIRPPANSRMVLEINGVEFQAPYVLDHEQIERGALLGLGRAVLLCLHWMRVLPKNNPVPGLLGVGQAAIKTRDVLRQVAQSDTPVLLLGETGTGKEVAANAIHRLSRRSARAFVSVNMAALNESLAAADLFGASKGAYTGAQNARAGLFTQAAEATLFLDEIGNTPASVQPMLLRVLETGDYRPLGAAGDLQNSARLIAATDQDLYDDSFNQALLRRLESFVVHLPPLRARREDIGVLLRHLLETSPEAQDVAPLSCALVTQFALYEWPGNVRQLKHVLKRCLLSLQLGDMPEFATMVDQRPARVTQSAAPSVIPTPVRSGTPAKPNPPLARKKPAHLSDAEVLAAMEANDWYIQGAAQALGISRPSMYKLLENHPQIRRPEQICEVELRLALQQSAGDLEDCAARLKTPSEALRRYLRGLAMRD